MMLSPNPQGVLLGTRVAAPVGGDLYAAATVQAVRNDATGNEFVTVKFDDNNKSECLLSEIVGNGFKSIHDIKLHRNQKVYMTYKGREVIASVEEHQNGFVRLKLPGFDKSISMKEEDVRLIENRYSPRQHDHDHDYRKIVQINASPSHGKKRPVSDSIEVPNVGRPRKMSHEPTMDELMAAMVLTNLSSSPVFYNPKSPTIHKAASSPHSFGSSGVGSWGHETQMSPTRGEHMAESNTRMTIGDPETTPERTRSVIHHTHSIEHSPSSAIDPIDIDTSGGLDTSVPMDESDTDVKSGGVVPPGHSTPAPFQSASSHIQFQGSSPSHNTAFLVKPGVKLESVKEEPVDREEVKYNQPQLVYIPPLLPIGQTARGDTIVHFGPIATPPLTAPNERQFSEVGAFPRSQLQADVPAPSPSNACIYIGSPSHALYTIPVMGSSPLNTNLTYSPAPGSKRAPSPLAVRNDRAATSTPPYPIRPHSINRFGGRTSSAQPINIPGMKAFSWHSAGVPQSYSPKSSILMQRQHLHQAASPKMYSMSPKTLPTGRKVRGDGKKCRKVYGMENRDMWCTACRWKKACQRFPD